MVPPWPSIAVSWRRWMSRPSSSAAASPSVDRTAVESTTSVNKTVFVPTLPGLASITRGTLGGVLG